MVDLRAGNVSIYTLPEPTLKPFKKIDTLGQYGHESLKGARPTVRFLLSWILVIFTPQSLSC